MSWTLLSIILGLEIAVVYLVSINVNSLLQATSAIRQWVLPLNDEHDDIREEMTRLCNVYSDNALAMLRNFRFIVVSASLAVFANIYGDPIVWMPFWASVGFAVGSALHLIQIDAMAQVLEYNTVSAQDELADRAFFNEVARLAEEIQDQVDIEQ